MAWQACRSTVVGRGRGRIGQIFYLPHSLIGGPACTDAAKVDERDPLPSLTRPPADAGCFAVDAGYGDECAVSRPGWSSEREWRERFLGEIA